MAAGADERVEIVAEGLHDVGGQHGDDHHS